nr:ribosomal protein S5 domain 2-like protein [Cryptomonas curvata]|mmetsp:Transcript_47652/g.99707  ORF Transcript_47652/g.99707 Transcript_47652/m.99707 type:complete len:295 (-) Transcript_47652:1024-1908(-)
MYIFNNERKYISNILIKGIRADGRNCSKNRALNIIMGPKKDFCDINQGGTHIIISSLIQSINREETKNSFLTYSFEIIISDKKRTYSYLDRINFFQKSNLSVINEIKRILNLITDKKKTNYCKNTSSDSCGIGWVIKFKIFVVENQGNLKDIIVLGVSLMNSSIKIPTYVLNGKVFNLNLQFNRKDQNEHLFSSFPLSFSFAVMETCDGDYLILFDPNNYEEYLSICILTIIVSSKNDILYVISGIGPGLDENIIKDAFRISVKRNNEIKKLLRNTFYSKNKENRTKEIIFINE